jgi:hypothetical protein
MQEENSIAGAQSDDLSLTVADQISAYEKGIEELRSLSPG